MRVGTNAHVVAKSGATKRISCAVTLSSNSVPLALRLKWTRKLEQDHRKQWAESNDPQTRKLCELGMADTIMEEVLLNMLPTEPKERKKYPIVTGVLDYFPDAIAEVSLVSLTGNDQHNPGERLHWAREKSTDQADCIGRHLLQRGTRDKDGMRHTAKVAWRALALLQEEIEQERRTT